MWWRGFVPLSLFISQALLLSIHLESTCSCLSPSLPPMRTCVVFSALPRSLSEFKAITESGERARFLELVERAAAALAAMPTSLEQDFELISQLSTSGGTEGKQRNRETGSQIGSFSLIEPMPLRMDDGGDGMRQKGRHRLLAAVGYRLERKLYLEILRQVAEEALRGGK